MPDQAELAASVARTLRAERTRRGWSLDALAARSGVSRGMLLQIEQARTNPSIGTLQRIADAFGTSLARLVEVAEAPVVRVVAADAVPTLWRGEGASAGDLLVGAEQPGLELWRFSVAPGDGYDGMAHAAGTRELLTIIDGTLTLSVDSVAHRVRAGEAALFSADRPHRYANEDDVVMTMVLVVALPPDAPDSDLPTHPGA